MSLHEKVKELAKSKNNTLDVCSFDMGFSKNYLTGLKKHQATSDKIVIMADYFNVSADYLLGRIAYKNSSCKHLDTIQIQEQTILNLEKSCDDYEKLIEKNKKDYDNLLNEYQKNKIDLNVYRKLVENMGI